MKNLHLHLPAFLLAVIASLALQHSAIASGRNETPAQVATWNAASGNWSDPLKWNPTGDPNSAAYDVIFNNGGSLLLDGIRNINTYNQTGGTFAIANGNSLFLNTSGSLAGGGVMNLGYDYLYQGAANVVFTVTNGTIQGYGEIGYNGLSLAVQANGVVSANSNGNTLHVNGGGLFTNNGLMRATGGGTLRLANTGSGTGTIRSENVSNISLESRITGGTLDNAASTGTINLSNGTLRDVTIATGSTVNNATNSHMENTLINRGLLTSFNQSLLLNTNTTLSGGGAIQLGYGYLYDAATNSILTNTDNTLRGYGEIGYNDLSLINAAAGVVQADVSGQPLQLNGSGTFTNNGLMRALNGGTLTFSGPSDVTNNSTIRSQNLSNVAIQNRIIGGTLDNAGSSGTINLNYGTLRNVTISTGSTVNNASNGRMENTLINRGLLTSFSNQSLLLTTNTTLSGGGAIQLGYGYLYDATGTGLTLTNTDNTLRGYGEIGYNNLNLINDSVGVVQADVAGQALQLNGGGTFTNNAVFKAVNGGTLSQVGTLTNFSGTTLNGGFYNVTSTGPVSTLTFGAGTITMNNANVVLRGVNSVFNAINSIQQNFGTFAVLSGRSFSTASDLASANTVKLDENSQINVTGNYSQGTNSRLYIEIGSNGPNPSFHVLNATGSAAVAGTLDVRLVNGFVPGPTQTYTIINAASRTGGFTQVHGADVTYTPTSVIIHPNGGAIPLVVDTAVSRKVHGRAGTFDLNLPFGGPLGVECRNGGANGNHTVVFSFNNDIASGNASVTAGTGSVSGSPTFLGNTMTVNLTGIADVQTITLTLSSVTDTFGQVLPGTAVSANMLVGDTTGNKTVNASDIGQTKSQSGVPVSAANFRNDVNVSGTINASDIGLVKANAGHSLP